MLLAASTFEDGASASLATPSGSVLLSPCHGPINKLHIHSTYHTAVAHQDCPSTSESVTNACLCLTWVGRAQTQALARVTLVLERVPCQTQLAYNAEGLKLSAHTVATFFIVRRVRCSCGASQPLCLRRWATPLFPSVASLAQMQSVESQAYGYTLDSLCMAPTFDMCNTRRQLVSNVGLQNSAHVIDKMQRQEPSCDDGGTAPC